MPLHTIHRPKTLDEIVGNDSVVASLKSVLRREQDRSHSFLFTGQSGCGKSTLARILKYELNCSDSDLYIYNTANTRGIDTMREIGENCQYAPMSGDVKLIILEECHMWTAQAAESILVLLEEPPSHVFFALCTTEPEKLKPTIKRRCHVSEVKPLNSDQLLTLLNSILNEEGVKDFPDTVLTKITQVCDGSPGKALNLLDTVIDIADDKMALQTIEEATISEATIANIAQVLIKGNGKWGDIALMIKGLSGEPESLRYAFLGYFNAVLLNNPRNHDKIAEILLQFVEPVMYSGKGGLTTEIYLAWKASLPTQVF